MSFKNNAYATLWNIKDTNSVVRLYNESADINISTQKKNKEGKYERDFSSIVRCVGSAFQKISAVNLGQKDRIKLIEVEVKNSYDKDAKKLYTNYICWDLEIVERKDFGSREPETIETNLEPLDDFDTLPF